MFVDVSREDLRQVHVKMRAELKAGPTMLRKSFKSKRLWSDATINRHFAFLRHVLMPAVKDGKLSQNPCIWFEVLPGSEAYGVSVG